ncbi:hypothetical protein [Pseudomonas sp.]|uniref:hypothetical protein n=1 Tax=Pseudomonas sp. TaxID=306 RepID=UPI0026DC1942|nr:hypothetical protein [Pseudomonas sp.]MDO4234172.1 hypothetical protein [Pseudomonas sp.]
MGTVTLTIQSKITPPGPSGKPFNTFYTCSRDSAQLCVLDPYSDEVSGKHLLVTGITLPLIENGKTIAVLGLDISLGNFQQNTVDDSHNLYDGKGEISILSPTGLIAGNSASPMKLGNQLQQVLPDNAREILVALTQAKPLSLLDNQRITVLEPLETAAGSKPWGVLLSVPQNVLLAPVYAMQDALDAARLRSSALEFRV